MHWLSKLFQKVISTREQSDGDVVKPFLEHLEDLRWTLFKMAAVLAIGMIVAFTFSEKLIQLIEAPLAAANTELLGNLETLSPIEGFMVTIRLAFYAGIVLSFPLLLFFLAEFILPALTRHEKKMIFPAIGAGFVLFGCGVLVAYSYILPHTLKWFYDYNTAHHFANRWRAGEYFTFVTHLTIACGLLCELPVAVLALSFLGLVSAQLLRNTRPYAMTLILILVAVISPSPDPITFITLALPVVAIYELCIWIVWAVEKRRATSETQ